MTQLGDKVRDKMSFTVKNVSDKKLDLNVISAAPGYFKVKLPSSIGPGQSVQAEVNLDKAVITKDFEKSFTIEVSDSTHDRFTVPVKRTVRPSIQTSQMTHASGHGK